MNGHVRTVRAACTVDAPGAIRRDVATVLFTDIEGFTRLTEVLPLERTAEIVGQYYDALAAAADATGGTVDRFMGDGALIYWTQSRHGPRHATLALDSVARLRAAFRTPQGAQRLAGGMPVRFGIHSGEVAVGRIGAAQTLVGDVVNVAARLQGAAKALPADPADDRIRGYVSAETLRRVGGNRVAGEFRRLTLSGRKSQILARRW